MKKTIFYLFLILSLSLGLRLYHLGTIPYGFFCDEADIGYTAYTIAQKISTPHPFLPFPVVPGVNGGRNPIPVYLTIPFVTIFGLTEFSVRLVSVAIGIFTVFMMFKVLKTLTTIRTSLFGAFLFGISPWLITFNRIGWEQSSWILFSLIYLYFLFRKKIILFYLSAGIAYYTYHPSWIVTSLMVGVATLIFIFHAQNLKRVLLGLTLFIAVVFPLSLSIRSGEALGRYKDVVATDNPWLTHNYKQVSKIYLDHFGVKFLFIQGDFGLLGNEIVRHSLRGMGQLYLFQIPLLISGVILLLLKKKWRGGMVLLSLLIAPIPDTLANSILSTRSFFEVIPLALISAVGLEYTVAKARSMLKIILWSVFITVAVMWFFYYYLFSYFKDYPLYSAGYWGWQSGPKEVFNYFMNQKGNNNGMYLDVLGDMNAPDALLRFYTLDKKLGCELCFLGGVEYYRKNAHLLFAIPPKKIGDYRAVPLRLLKEIRYPSGEVSFGIYETIGE